MPDVPPTSVSKWSIRDAQPADLHPVMALLAAAHLAPNALDAQFGPQFAVACNTATGDLIGACGIEVYRDGAGEHGLLRSAVVDAGWRGDGLGAALTADRIAWAERSGLAGLYLLTETAADYWPRFGFARIDRGAAPAGVMAAHEWQSGCPASAVAMTLPLPRSAA